MFISCAAGNEYGPVGYPAVYPECYAVSAVNKDMRLADFSNRGKEIDFAAPGVGIKSSVPSGGYEEWDGTSMAAPHVSGTIAIMLSRNKRKLKAKNIGLHQEEQGFGLIDAYKTGKNFFPWQN
jgi:serine protease